MSLQGYISPVSMVRGDNAICYIDGLVQQSQDAMPDASAHQMALQSGGYRHNLAVKAEIIAKFVTSKPHGLRIQLLPSVSLFQ